MPRYRYRQKARLYRSGLWIEDNSPGCAAVPKSVQCCGDPVIAHHLADIWIELAVNELLMKFPIATYQRSPIALTITAHVHAYN